MQSAGPAHPTHTPAARAQTGAFAGHAVSPTSQDVQVFTAAPLIVIVASHLFVLGMQVVMPPPMLAQPVSRQRFAELQTPVSGEADGQSVFAVHWTQRPWVSADSGDVVSHFVPFVH